MRMHSLQRDAIETSGVGRPARAPFVGLITVAVLLVPALAPGQVPRTPARGGPTMIYEGFTEPKHSIMVAASEIGRLKSVDADIGDRVTAGQVIGQLEDSLQASSVEIAKLHTEMVGELTATEAEAELHQIRTKKLRKLAADGMARPDELVRAETDLRIALGRLAAAKEQLQLRKLELARYRVQLERRKIRVPLDGVVSEVFRQPGEYITPSDPSIVRLLVIDKLYAVFSIPVEDTIGIKVGSPAKVILRSTAKTIDAAISSIAPAIDGESGTVQVRIVLDNPKGTLLPGDRCTLRLDSRTAKRPQPLRPTRLGGSMR